MDKSKTDLYKRGFTPYAMQQSIDIPDAVPNGRAIVSVESDARGTGDTFKRKLVMVDKDIKSTSLLTASIFWSRGLEPTVLSNLSAVRR